MSDIKLLLFELVNAVNAAPVSAKKKSAKSGKSAGADKTVAEWLADMPSAMGTLFESLETYLLSLGDDVQRKDLKLYVAFKRLRNFVTVCFQNNHLRIFLNLDPAQARLAEGFTRDVSAIGHWETGNLEITLKTLTDLDRAKPLLVQAYEGGSHAG